MLVPFLEKNRLPNMLPNVAGTLAGQLRARVLHILSGLVIVEVVIGVQGIGELLWEGPSPRLWIGFGLSHPLCVAFVVHIQAFLKSFQWLTFGEHLQWVTHEHKAVVWGVIAIVFGILAIAATLRHHCPAASTSTR